MPRFTVKRLIALTTAVAVTLTIARLASAADVLFQGAVAAYTFCVAAWLVFRSPIVCRNLATLRERRRRVHDRWAKLEAEYGDKRKV